MSMQKKKTKNTEKRTAIRGTEKRQGNKGNKGREGTEDEKKGNGKIKKVAKAERRQRARPKGG